MGMTLSMKELLEWLEAERKIVKDGQRYSHCDEFVHMEGQLHTLEEVICYIMRHMEI